MSIEIQSNEEVFHQSPLGAFQKPNKKVRVIHDLSWPPNGSVNDGISKKDYSVSYSSVDDAVEFCKKFKNPWLAKCDLEDAYMSCPVRIEDRKLLGFNTTIDGKIINLRFACYPFGLRSSPRAFSDLAKGMLHMAKNNGTLDTTISYLDDTICVASSESECKQSIDTFIKTAQKCGFKIQESKTEGPARKLEFLGILIDTETRTLAISEKRLAEIRLELKDWLGKSTCSKRQLLSLLGKLAFCSKVVNHGSMFTRRLIEKSKTVKNLHQKVRLNSECKKDIVWWYKCIANHNGVAWFKKQLDPSNAMLVFSDASDIAAAGVVGNKWTVLKFCGKNAWMAKKSIAWREMLAVLLTISTLGMNIKYSDVLMNIDNQAIQLAIQAGKCKDREIMCLIRALYWYCALYHIHYATVHIRSQVNCQADALSRDNVMLFRQFNPASDLHMTPPIDFLMDF